MFSKFYSQRKTKLPESVSQFFEFSAPNLPATTRGGEHNFDVFGAPAATSVAGFIAPA